MILKRIGKCAWFKNHAFNVEVRLAVMLLFLVMASTSAAQEPRKKKAASKQSEVPAELVEGVLPDGYKVVLHEQKEARSGKELGLWSDGTSLIRNGLRYHTLITQTRQTEGPRFIGIYLDAPFFTEHELHLFEMKNGTLKEPSPTFHRVGEVYIRAYKQEGRESLIVEYHVPPFGEYRPWFERFEEAREDEPFPTQFAIWDPSIDRFSLHSQKGMAKKRHDTRWVIRFMGNPYASKRH